MASQHQHRKLHAAVSLLISLNLACAFQITGVSTGVNTSTGQRPFRTEISQFAQSGPPFDLYILALQVFQHLDPNDQFSYYQIAGIHGFPHDPWDGVLGNQTLAGYCTHGATTFPAWHRPYLALFEQTLVALALEIAQSYPSNLRDQYVEAALNLRIPYWDWAAYPSLPNATTSRTMTVTGPNGTTTLENPLYRYDFEGVDADKGFQGNQFTKYNFTVRNWDNVTQQSDLDEANALLGSNAATILSIVYQMFSESNYSTISTTTGSSGPNLENPHNGIHDMVGGNNDKPGHMTDLTVSAFDPIFWLHHCNVDRLFALWQTLHPDSYVLPTLNPTGTYTDAPNSVISADTALTPFHSDNGTTFFTANTVRDTRTFGYTYPELVDWNVTAAGLAANVKTQINALYNPQNPQRARSGSITLQDRKADVAQSFGHITFDLAKSLGVNNLPMQWSINVEVQRFAYPQSFIIYFFMGEAPTDLSKSQTAPNLIGTYVNLNDQNLHGMYPNGPPEVLQHGMLSLTHVLAAGVARGLLDDLSVKSVTPLLTQHLTWKARAVDGSEVALDLLAGLSISVASRVVKPITSMSELPEYAAYKQHRNITHDKPGGVKVKYRLAT